MNYHVHIYFDVQQKQKIELLIKKLLLELALLKIKFVCQHDKPVGPHIKPMVELNFQENAFPVLQQWLSQNVDDFSCLIHRDTGDDLKDHGEGFLWLGKPLPLNFEFFNKIKQNPELKVHF